VSDSRTLEAAGEALMRALLEARVLSEAFAGPLRTLTESWGAVGGQVYALQGSEQGAEWSFRGSFGPSGAAVHPTPLQLERLRTGEQLSSVPYHHALYGCSQVLGQGLWSENTLVGVLWLGFDAEPRWLLEPLEGLCRLWGRQLERLRVREPETLREPQPVAAMRRMLDLSPALLGVLDERGRLLNLNRATERTLGYAPAELIGKNLLELGFAEDQAEFAAALEVLLKPSSTPTVVPLRLRHAAGGEVWLEWSVSFGLEESRLYCIARDITEERQARLSLERSEARFRSLTQHSSDLVSVVDVDGFVRYLSGSVERMLGYSSEKGLDKRVFEYIHPEDVQAAWSLFSSLLVGESSPATFRFRRFDGSWCWLDAVGTNLLDDPDVNGLVINARDAGERKSFEAHITALNARLERQVQRLTTLHAIDQSIASSLDLGATLTLLLEQTLDQLGVDAAAILLLDFALDELQVHSYRGFRTDLIGRVAVPLGKGLAGRVALERRARGLDAEGESALERGTFWQAEGFHDYHAAPLLIKGELYGVLEVFHRARLETDSAWLEFLEALAGQAALAVEKSSLLHDLQTTNLELVSAYDATIEGWAKALELRDFETEGHSRRVTTLSLKLGHKLKLSLDDLEHLRRGALLHDIGKMGIPDHILLKKGALSSEEWAVMRKHPTYAFELLFPVGFLRPALDIPYSHHERWDGNGYPRSLAGEQIPRSARIFAVVDVFDALSSDRPYRKGWAQDKVLSHLRQGAGSQFDPLVVAAFLELIEEEGDWLFEDETVYFNFEPLEQVTFFNWESVDPPPNPVHKLDA